MARPGALARTLALLLAAAPGELSGDELTRGETVSAPAASAQAEPAAVEPAAVETASIEPAPAESEPVEPAPVRSASIAPAPGESAPDRPAQGDSAPVQTARLGAARLEPGQVESAAFEPPAGEREPDARPRGGPHRLHPAFLELVVNTVPSEPVLVHVDGGDVWVPVEALGTLGARAHGGARRTLQGVDHVSLASLAQQLSFEVDEAALQVRITAGPALLGRSALDLRAIRRPAGLERIGAPSAFLSYSARGTTDETFSASAEFGVGSGDWLALGSASRLPDGSVLRGLATLSLEKPERLLRLTAGEVVVRPEPLGSGPVVLGLGIVRDATIDPYYPRPPLPRATVFATTPSTLEVWVNGALVRTAPVAPGALDLSGLPVTTGQNDVRLVVRDAFGRAETVDASHYQAQGLLAPGLHELAWNVGLIREGYGRTSFDYGRPVLLGSHLLGVTDALTVGARLEATPEVASGGLSAVAGLPAGQLQLAMAASRDARRDPLRLSRVRPGAAALLAWRLTFPTASLGADLSWTSADYATSAPRAALRSPEWRGGLLASTFLGRSTSLQVRATGALLDGGHREGRLETSLSLRLARQVLAHAAVAVGGHSARSGTELNGQLSLSYTPAARTHVELAGEGSRRAGSSRITAQRSLPVGEGFGYRMTATGSDDRRDLSALVQAQAAHGRYEAGYDRIGGASVGSASFAGGLAFVSSGERLLGDGALFVTRPIEQSYALVSVPGVPGVQAFLNNHPVGRTDDAGNVLVSGLLPHYGNRVAIADADVPLTHAMGRTERVVAPPRRGAALVRFDVTRLTAVTGTLLVTTPGGAVVPAYGTIRVETREGELASPISSAGAFWLEGLPAGTHFARITWAGQECKLFLSIPADPDAAIQDLGPIACTKHPASDRFL